MDEPNQRQGAEEALTEMKEEASNLAERSQTVESRLDSYISSQETTQEVKEPSVTTEDKQPEPTPSSNQPEEDTNTAPNKVSSDDPKLPEDASDRTKERFNQILEENKRLKEQARKAAGSSVFDTLRGEDVPPAPQVPQYGTSQFSNLSQEQINTTVNQFVSPDGTVDIDGLNKALSQANSRAAQSETQARLAWQQAQETRQRLERFEETQQVREAHAKHPQLAPKLDNGELNPNWDENFYNLTAMKLATSWRAGNKITLAQAADDVAQNYIPGSREAIEEEAINRYKKTLQTRSSQTPVGNSRGEPREKAQATDKELSERTRNGDPFALDERLKKAGIL